MKRCLLLLLVVAAFAVPVAADVEGMNVSTTSVHVSQWSVSGLPVPILPVGHNPVLLPGIVLFPAVSPSPLLLHSVILAPTPNPILSPHLLPVVSPSVQLTMLPLLGWTHGSILGDNVTLIGMQLNQMILP
ncbi:MAG: hypothetical protein A2Y76_00255 [Planctomycetes bacterium RBG_13_60_9]|nr:MAG: hypothetical protein A2Y76_00255 [Planctomycetes bacterium RBG_13_60_9]